MGGLEKNLIFESPEFAFQTRPDNYRDYLVASINHAEDYMFDAVPFPLRLYNQPADIEKALESLSGITTEMGIGLVFSAPFTCSVREVGATKFFLEVRESLELQNLLSLRTQKSIDLLKRFEDFVDFAILIDPMACNNLISSDYFKKFVFPSYNYLSQSTSLPIVIHTPGKIKKNLPYILESGIKGIQPIDSDELEDIIEGSNKRIQVMGNFNRKLLVYGDGEDIRLELERCRKAHNGYFIFHTNFWIPRRANPKKVKYLSDLIKN